MASIDVRRKDYDMHASVASWCPLHSRPHPFEVSWPPDCEFKNRREAAFEALVATIRAEVFDGLSYYEEADA